MTRFGRVYYPKKYETWKKQAEAFIRHLVQSQTQGALHLSCEFLFAVPKSYTKAERAAALAGETWPRPDCDNLAKSVLDAMTAAGAWQDDSQVVQMVARKRYAERDEIRVTVTKNGP